MTDGDREAGRWQGNVDARLVELTRRVEGHERQLHDRGLIMQDHQVRIKEVENRLSLVWSGLIAVVVTLAGAVFKIWAEGGF